MTQKDRRSEAFEFRLILALLFPVFFVATLIKRVMPWNWGRDPRSIFSAARAAVYNTLPFAFM